MSITIAVLTILIFIHCSHQCYCGVDPMWSTMYT